MTRIFLLNPNTPANVADLMAKVAIVSARRGPAPAASLGLPKALARLYAAEAPPAIE